MKKELILGRQYKLLGNLAKRIIPCLDVTDGRVVKGVNFVNLTDAGDPVEISKSYDKAGADELVFLDITATAHKTKTADVLASEVSKQVFIPFTVGGGIKTVLDMRKIIMSGADKISINSQAVRDSNLISEGAKKFGSQAIVVAIDAKKNDDGTYSVFLDGGRTKTNLDAIKWAKEVENLGAGEILLTSMDQDGTKNGFEIELTQKVSDIVNIPVIASGGAGKKEDFLEVFSKTKATGALAASLFHFKELEILELKNYLSQNSISVRI